MIILYRAGGEKDTVVVWSDMVCLLNCHEADVNTYCTALLTTRHLRRVILNVVSICCVCRVVAHSSHKMLASPLRKFNSQQAQQYEPHATNS